MQRLNTNAPSCLIDLGIGKSLILLSWRKQVRRIGLTVPHQELLLQPSLLGQMVTWTPSTGNQALLLLRRQVKLNGRNMHQANQGGQRYEPLDTVNKQLGR
jgi:hypothetical protein